VVPLAEWRLLKFCILDVRCFDSMQQDAGGECWGVDQRSDVRERQLSRSAVMICRFYVFVRVP